MLLHSNLHRCHAEVLLDILAKERCVWETQQVTDLLDAIVGLFQIIADVFKYMFCYPFAGSLAGMLLAYKSEMFG